MQEKCKKCNSAEIMKGIRVYHERDNMSMGINYKIIFENIYRIEKE